jgi:hypothetical protein
MAMAPASPSPTTVLLVQLLLTEWPCARSACRVLGLQASDGAEGREGKKTMAELSREFEIAPK